MSLEAEMGRDKCIWGSSQRGLVHQCGFVMTGWLCVHRFDLVVSITILYHSRRGQVAVDMSLVLVCHGGDKLQWTCPSSWSVMVVFNLEIVGGKVFGISRGSSFVMVVYRLVILWVLGRLLNTFSCSTCSTCLYLQVYYFSFFLNSYTASTRNMC